jgi:CYTH domain-containing protein
LNHLEIERKFLVDREKWLKVVRPAGILYRQGYLSIDPLKTIRVRVAGDRGSITIKGKAEGIIRSEFEYSIPAGEATLLIDRFTRNIVEKTRYRVPVGDHVFDVDEFHGMNDGLLMAEIELGHSSEEFKKPDWLGEEVTDNPRYYNSYLSQNPYFTWK